MLADAHFRPKMGTDMYLAHLFWTAICLALLMPPSAIALENSPKVIDDPAYTHAQRLVEVEPGRRLNLYCLGKGSPTVVFDAGAGDENAVWALVQPVIATHTRACSYDRAGYGYSDPGKRAGTSANFVDDLRRLLVAAPINPPYILVGHSFGGMNVRLYADTYPAEVVGMVLVDPTLEGWRESAWKLDKLQRSREAYVAAQIDPDVQARRECMEAASAGFVEGTDLYKRCVAPPNPHFSDEINRALLKIHRSPGYQQAVSTEEENMLGASDDQLLASRRWYGNMPLIVLTAPHARRPSDTQERSDVLNAVWVYLYDQLAALSTRGVVRRVPDTGHYIQLDKPDAVNNAIVEVLGEATQQK